jgi:hypothetical protein
MTKDSKHRFLSKLEQMAEELYRRGDSINHDEAWERQRSFLWGYGDAGKTINLVSAEEIQVVIDRAHERVYSESRENRIERLKPILDDSGDIDWDAFESPSYERKTAG